ncbi:MAG TPA: DNA-binding response regulator [Firmicutes bacterium]|nr:DNA-binding response regulator [Bacillota bacterium]
MPEKILIVEDEKSIAEILQYNLEEDGFHVIVANDGADALRLAFSKLPDLILLDLMLPRIDGYSVCRRIRDKMDVPIIMLTAREAEVDKVLGLELGADDYVTKPFSMRELLARIRAALRRVKMQDKTSVVLICGDISLEPARMECKKKGREIELTYLEFNLLLFLLNNEGYVFSRDKLLEEVWGYDYLGDARTVDVTIRRLREKIEDDPGNPIYLCTRRGAGYYLRRPS